MAKFAKVEKKSGKIVEVSPQRIELPENEKTTHEVKQVADTAKAGDPAAGSESGT